ncbi:hypothetical protein HNQ88_001573 [Aureibacter tunicatorum]|uniref:Uncharacterized protein n=1 Tax=Aureibacter tunicatorum TaxID=866807 RepID=A0AAE3XIU7_9BACT|nr:hypothetical protein [Aureibacter tunicatorum]
MLNYEVRKKFFLRQNLIRNNKVICSHVFQANRYLNYEKY